MLPWKLDTQKGAGSSCQLGVELSTCSEAGVQVRVAIKFLLMLSVCIDTSLREQADTDLHIHGPQVSEISWHQPTRAQDNFYATTRVNKVINCQ